MNPIETMIAQQRNQAVQQQTQGTNLNALVRYYAQQFRQEREDQREKRRR